MNFEFEERVSYPLDRVFEALRDRLAELPPFLPEVDSIELRERTEGEDGSISVLNIWQGSQRNAPLAVRRFISKEMLAWRDVGVWREDPRRVEWRFETMHFESLYECEGVNYFEAIDEENTRIRMTGTLSIYPEKVPGVPRRLARRLAPTIEKWLMNMVTPNLARLPHAIQALLDSDGS